MPQRHAAAISIFFILLILQTSKELEFSALCRQIAIAKVQREIMIFSMTGAQS